MDGVELFAVEVDDGGHVGVAWDQAAGVCGAVLRVRSEGVVLDDDATRDQRLAAWGGVLAAVARDGSPVHRLQWMQRTVAADGAAAAAWFEARAVEGAAAESYRRLLAAATPGDRRHDSVVAVSVSADRAGVHGRGRAVVRDRLVAVLLDEVGLLAGQLTGAGFTVDGAATPAGLIGLLRRGFDPFTAVSTAVSNDAAVVWPVASEATWRSHRTDGAWHATYWIEQWPRSPVAGDFLAPLTMGVLEAGSVSVIAEPVAAARAHRQVQRDLVSSATNDALRTRAGFRITARRMHRNAAVARREHELAVGHAEYRVVGLLTVSARHSDELESACGRLEQAAQQAHLGVRRLWGRQPAAFAAAQPLALGLR
jgi:hypothetical protein